MNPLTSALERTGRAATLRRIEKLLIGSGWFVSPVEGLDLSRTGVAVREVPFRNGIVDYLLLLKGFPVGIVVSGESEEEVLGFSRHPDFEAISEGNQEPLRFVYLCTQSDTFFVDLRSKQRELRRIFTIHPPSLLYKWSPGIDSLAAAFRASEILERARMYRVAPAEEPLPLVVKEIPINAEAPDRTSYPEKEKERDPGIIQVSTTTHNFTLPPKEERRAPRRLSVRRSSPRKKAPRKKAPRARKSNRLPLGIYGIFGVDRIRNVAGEERAVFAGPGAYSASGAAFFGRVSVAGSVGENYEEPYELKGLDKSSLGKVKDRLSAVTSWKHSKAATAALTPSVRQNASQVLPKVSKRFAKAAAILLGGAPPASQSGFFSALPRRPKVAILQASSGWLTPGGKKAARMLLAKAQAVLITEREARKFTSERNVSKAAEKMAFAGPRIVVIRQSEGGTFIHAKEGRFFSPPYPVKNPIDPTGAWEVFGGAFSGYLASKGRLDLETAKRAAIWGEALSSVKKEGYGLSRVSSARKSEILKRVAEIRKSIRV